MPKIHSVKEPFDLTHLRLSNPINKNGSHFIKTLAGEDPLYFLAPKSFVKQGFVTHGKKIFCDFVFSNEESEFLTWMEDLELTARSTIYTNREKWFETPLDDHDIESSMSSPYKFYKSGKFFIVRANVPTALGKINIKIYDENEEETEPENIKENTNVLAVFEFQGIKCSVRSFQFEIELKQLLVVEPEKLFDKCIISKSVKNPLAESLAVVTNNSLTYEDESSTACAVNVGSLRDPMRLRSATQVGLAPLSHCVVAEGTPNADIREPLGGLYPKVSPEGDDDSLLPSADGHSAYETDAKRKSPLLPARRTSLPLCAPGHLQNPSSQANDPNSFTASLRIHNKQCDPLTQEEEDKAIDSVASLNTPMVAAAADRGFTLTYEDESSATQVGLAPHSAVEDSSSQVNKENADIISPPAVVEILDGDFPLEESTDANGVEDQPLKLKPRNDVYYKLYKEAREKAREAKRAALANYLEAKRIKSTYLLEDISDSDNDSDLEEFEM